MIDRIKEMREREKRVEAAMSTVDYHTPKHQQMERVLLAARQARKRLERARRKEQREGARA